MQMIINRKHGPTLFACKKCDSIIPMKITPSIKSSTSKQLEQRERMRWKIYAKVCHRPIANQKKKIAKKLSN